jgi:hypothetical protein
MKFRNIFRRKNYDLPSVTDFESSDALQRALGGTTLNAKKPLTESSSSASLATVSTVGEGDNTAPNSITNDVTVVEWKLPTFDAETTNGQTMEKELERLLVLRSFSLLDTGREEHFDRLVP